MRALRGVSDTAQFLRTREFRVSDGSLNRLLIRHRLDHKQRCYRDGDTDRQADPCVLNESGDNEHYKGYCRNGDSVGHLR